VVEMVSFETLLYFDKQMLLSGVTLVKAFFLILPYALFSTFLLLHCLFICFFLYHKFWPISLSFKVH